MKVMLNIIFDFTTLFKEQQNVHWKVFQNVKFFKNQFSFENLLEIDQNFTTKKYSFSIASTIYSFLAFLSHFSPILILITDLNPSKFVFITHMNEFVL